MMHYHQPLPHHTIEQAPNKGKKIRRKPSNLQNAKGESKSKKKRLLALQKGECKWPTHEDMEGHMFCGHKCTGPYCDRHAKKSVQPPVRRK